MSKKYKGKTCVYCGVAVAVTGDHVFARKLFLEDRRADLPKVPSCVRCNGEKASLEHYLASVLPFGGRHADAPANLADMVPPRLERNAALCRLLRRGVRRAWVPEGGLLLPTMTIPVDWHALQVWVTFLVKGMSWHHWGVLVAADCMVDVVALPRHGEQFFERLFGMRAAARVREEVGGGTFSYEAAQGVDNPYVSVWTFVIYGGITLAGDPEHPEIAATKLGVLVGPRAIFERAARRMTLLRSLPPQKEGKE